MGQTRERSGLGRTVGVFALGATAGSVLALLFAPASGKETRKRIQLRIRELQQATSTLQRAATKKIKTARTWVMDHMPNGHVRRPTRHRPVHA